MEKFKILSDVENPLFRRREITFETDENSVPKKENVEKMISEKFSSPSENTEIKKISGKFGSKTFHISAFLYNSKELKEEIESRPRKKAEKQAAAK